MKSVEYNIRKIRIVFVILILKNFTILILGEAISLAHLENQIEIER